MQALQELVEQYIDNCSFMKGLNRKSIKAYSIDMKQYVDYQSEQEEWFTKNTVENYIKHTYLIYKPRTAKRKIACLKSFFHYLDMEEIITVSPFHKIKITRREPVILPKTIPINIVSKMLGEAYKRSANNECSELFRKRAIRDAAVMELLFASGVRVCELCTLLPGDIEHKSSMIKVQGKGSKERYIQITNKNVQSILKTYQKIYSNEIEQSGYFFVNNYGNRLSEQSVRIMIDKYSKLIGSDIHITPHMFRHTIATLLLEEDVDIRYIQELLGHSSITTTQIYTHISMNAQKRIFTKKHPRNKIKVSTD